MPLPNPARPAVKVGLASGLVGFILGWTLHVILTPKPAVDDDLQKTLALIHQQNQQLLHQIGANPQALARPPVSSPAPKP